MRVAAAFAGAALLAVGVVAGALLARASQETETLTETVTLTTTAATVSDSQLPARVEETRAALLAAAEAGDYEELRPYVSPELAYTFGGPVEGGPIAYWQELERTTDERPLETLAELLRLPYVLSRGIYVWPWTYTVERAADLSAHERELLAPLGSPGELFAPGAGYLGWRTGISPDGTWTFFVAGD